MRSKHWRGGGVVTALLLFAVAPLLAARPDLWPGTSKAPLGVPLAVWLVIALLAALLCLIWAIARAGEPGSQP